MRPFVLLLALCCALFVVDAQAAEKVPMLLGGSARAGVGKPLELTVEGKDLPTSTTSVAWTAELPPSLGKPEVAVSKDQPAGSTLTATEQGSQLLLTVTAPKGALLESKLLATLTFPPAKAPLARTPVALGAATASLVGGTSAPLQVEHGTVASALITDPVILATYLSGLIALIFLLARVKALETFFRYMPPLIWMYFLPMISTTFAITPDSSVLFSPFMSRVVLPAILVLLLIPSDISGLRKLGGKALLMMLAGTVGIVLGAIISFAFFNWLMPASLPKDSWKGIAALSGSWIGGSTNMMAVIESLNTPGTIVGPLVIVDTVCAYSWLGILVALSTYQVKIDKMHGANTEAIDSIGAHLELEYSTHSRAPKTGDVGLMLGLAMVLSQICLWLGVPIYNFFTQTLKLEMLSSVINGYGWGVLLITAAGLLLSMTPVRKLDYCGASAIGNVGLYALLTCYGAQADLRAVAEVPVFFGIGIMWILIHVIVLYIAMRVLKAPLFMASTASMANIGGTASAPVVAAAYHTSLAPIGLLMAILGGVLGTPVALFVVAVACRAIAGQ